MDRRGLVGDDEIRDVYPLREMFTRMNTKIRGLNMEIKSVLTKKASETFADSSGDGDDDHEVEDVWIYHHGIVNTDADPVATNFGSYFEVEEIKVFQEILTQLIEKDFLSTHDMYHEIKQAVSTIKSSAWTTRSIDAFLEKLIAQQWLRRNDRGYYVIGLKAFLELRSYLEGIIRDSKPSGMMSDEEHQNFKHSKIAKIPQVIIY